MIPYTVCTKVIGPLFCFISRGYPDASGFDSASASFLYTERKERLQNEHEVLRNASVLQGEGEAITEENAKLSLSVSEEARAEANTLVADCEQPFVTMAPGSVWATKRWPAEYFAKLADHIAAKGFRVVLIGGPAERDVAEVVQAGCSARLINTVGRTTPQSSAALISESVATICNDSAPTAYCLGDGHAGSRFLLCHRS